MENLRPDSWTVAVNNHVDVDGILSIYALVHGEHALARRFTTRRFAGSRRWSMGPIRKFPRLKRRLARCGAASSFSNKAGFLERSSGADWPITSFRWMWLTTTTRALPTSTASTRRFRKKPFSGRKFVHVGMLRGSACFPSSGEPAGFTTFCFPGYLWADTAGKWIVPGMTYHDGMASFDLDNSNLISAFEELQRQEVAFGRWALGGTNLPFAAELQDQFPLVGRFLSE